MTGPEAAVLGEGVRTTLATLKDVAQGVEEARKAYELFVAKDALSLEELDDYNHFSPETQKVVYERLKQVAGF